MTSRLGQGVRGRGAAGGEGMWYDDGGCGFINVEVTVSDIVFVWADGTPTFVGTGSLIHKGGGIWVYYPTGTETAEIDKDAGTDGLIAHKIPVTLLTTSGCS